MNTKSIVVIVTTFAMLLALTCKGLAQSQPVLSGTLKPGGVSSRNMELLDVISMHPENHDQFETAVVTYPVGSSSVTRTFILASTHDGSGECLKLIDVTNPRSSSVFMRLSASGSSSSSTIGEVSFANYQVYKDTRTPESNTFNGDVFLVVWVGNVQVSSAPLNARFMVINLTKACTLVDGAASNEVKIHNASVRDVTLGTTVTGNKNVYIGYILHDPSWQRLSNGDPQTIHGLTVDAESGIMVMTPNALSRTGSTPYVPVAHIDCFDLSRISVDFTPGVSTLGEIVRLKTGTANKPIEITGLSNSALALPRDVYVKKLSSGNVRLTMAIPQGANTFVHGGTTYNNFGGVLTRDMDYSSPAAVTFSNTYEWAYDSDRDTPLKRFSTNTNWQYRVCHTAIPFYHTSDDVYVLTSDELANPKWNPLETDTVNRHTIVGGAWIGGIDKSILDGTVATLQDDRRVGSFTRVWRAEESSSGLELQQGSTTSGRDGPMSFYDPIESTDPDDLYYAAGRTADPSDRSIATIASYGTSSSNRLAPTSTHRPYAVPPFASNYDANNNDVYTSNYAQGVRVINLTEIESTNHPVLEKGFFDFIPLLTYDANDPYFYKLSPQYQAKYGNFVKNEDRYPIYWLGVLHCVPDFGPSRAGTDGTGTLPADEKFVYALAKGEGKLHESITIGADTEAAPDNPGITIAADPSDVTAEEGRNWLPEGGFLILRYFDGKLGGTIKGYEGTGSSPRKWSRRPYQTINLQGDFTVERDVTVAAGACVQLLPGHESDPGIFASTSLMPPSSGDKTVYVDGVLNISIPEGDAIGTDIVIDVPIVVRDGGVLNIYNIRSGKKVMFKKKVIVQSGGTWKFHKSSNVELYYEDHEANGKLIVDGDEDGRVKITSRRNGTSYSKSAYIVGRGTTDNAKSLVSIEYADITNTYTDLDRITVNSSTFTIKESDFRTTRNAERGGLFLFKLTRPLSEYVSWGTFRRRQAKVRITNTDFTDALSGLPALQSIQFAAMVSDAASLYLTNVGLDKFLVGLFAKDNDGVYITDCQITNSTMGVVAENGSSVICNTDFYNNEFSSTKYGTGSGQYKDNSYSVMKGGANIQNSGVQYFRNNEFSAYCYGVQSWGTTLFMRNEVRPGNDIEYGRNDFLVNTDQYGVWGCPTTDIGMARAAQLIVNCGYNQFSGASAYHVTGDNTCPAVDVSYNQWNPGAGYNPRFYNINWNGDNRNVQQDREPDCGIVFNNLVVCNAPGLPPRGGEGYSELGFNDASLYTAASSVRTEVQDAGIGWRNRRDKAWEYFEIVSKIDSSTYQEVLKSDMQTILANSSLDSTLRSAALFIKASMHSARGEYDSAKTALSTLRSTYPLKSDSVPANWETMYINAITDTTGKVDSLIGVYLDRVLTDLRRKTTYGSTGLSKVNIDRGESIAGSGLVVSMNGPTHPNPSTTGRAVMTISSNKTTKCFVDVFNVQGQVTDSFEYSLSSGENRVEINTEMFPPGTYTAQIRCDDSINRVSFVVTK